MIQILSTLANIDAVVQGYQKDSKLVEVSVSDHLKKSNSNTAKCFLQWKHWLRVTLPLHLGSMRGTTGTPRLQSQIQWSRRRYRRLHLFLILSQRRLRRPWGRHPVNPVVVVSFLSPSTRPTIASTIRTLVRTQGGRGGGRKTTNTPITKNLLCRGEPQKSRKNLLSPSGGRCLRAKNTPPSLLPRGPVRRRTPLRGRTSIPSRKMFQLPPGNPRTGTLTLRTRVQFLQ